MMRKYRVSIRYEFDVLASSEDDAMEILAKDFGTLDLDSDHFYTVEDVNHLDWDDFYPVNLSDAYLIEDVA